MSNVCFALLVMILDHVVVRKSHGTERLKIVNSDVVCYCFSGSDILLM